MTLHKKKKLFYYEIIPCACKNKLKKQQHIKPLLIPPFTPTPLSPHPCSSLWALLIFGLCSSTGMVSAVSSPRAEVLCAASGL